MAWMAACELIGLSYDTKPFRKMELKLIKNEEKEKYRKCTETLWQIGLFVDKDFGW